jgi:enoyl-CoA hydratase
MYKNIKYEVKGCLAYITINRPESMNAINMDVLKELKHALKNIADDSAIRAVIVTGEGRAFVAGADIKQMKRYNPVRGRQMMTLGHEVMDTIDSMPVPFIAAVNGYALGGGCELAMACDIRIASTKAKFGQPEVGLGIIPGFGGTQRLARLVGKGWAKYLIYSADMIDAAKAEQIGLVQKVVEPDELMKEAEKVANMIASKAPIAVATAKTTINDGYDADIRTGGRLEIEAEAACFGTKDKGEGMSAFLQKRDPKWEGK